MVNSAFDETGAVACDTDTTENVNLKDQSVRAEEETSLVHVTALLQNSPHATVKDECLKAILEILNNKEHVRENISDIIIGNIFNQKTYAAFNHRVEILLHVKKSRLWERAQRYIWKHIGTCRWSLPDGTQISFNKIHQKEF